MSTKLQVKGIEIVLLQQHEEDFISLTDIARYKNPEHPADVIKNRMRSRNTLEFLGIWEKINNPSTFNLVDFDQFIKEAWANSFVMTPQKWIDSTHAVWIISKSWRGWGTYAHKDIAFKFASWISPEFELYVIKDYQRLKQQEEQKKAIWRDVKRMIAKINYKIHTDAIQQYRIPWLSEFQQQYAYADEADMLNLIVFGCTAKEWRESNADLAKVGNIRDHAHALELVILANLESFNAQYLEQWLSQDERYELLSKIAQTQRQSLSKQYQHLDTLWLNSLPS